MENKLFNEEQKERYLSIYDNEETQNTIRRIFHKSWIFEDMRNRDLANFNLEEIGKVIEFSNPFNLSVGKATARFISGYISWCIENGLRQNNISPLDGVSNEWIEKHVDKTKKIFHSYSEFLGLLEELKNYQDKALLFVLFEGISGRSFSEIRELKVDDLRPETNEVYVRERDQLISVDKLCMEYLQEAAKENIYYSYIEKENRYNEKELLDSEGYIFKNVRAGRTSEGKQVSMAVLYNRLNNIKEIFSLEYLTGNSIKMSGQIYYAYLLYKEYGKLEYEQFEIIGKKYNGSMIHSGEYHYYNSNLMKEYINQTNIKELYGIDIEF